MVEPTPIPTERLLVGWETRATGNADNTGSMVRTFHHHAKHHKKLAAPYLLYQIYNGMTGYHQVVEEEHFLVHE